VTPGSICRGASMPHQTQPTTATLCGCGFPERLFVEKINLHRWPIQKQSQTLGEPVGFQNVCCQIGPVDY